jgi:hypothetical protein
MRDRTCGFNGIVFVEIDRRLVLTQDKSASGWHYFGFHILLVV